MAAVIGAACGPALAQDLPPPAARIQRQADSPLRWILEAGKLKPRAKPAEVAAPARPTPPKPAVRTAAAPAPRSAASAAASRPAEAAVPADAPAASAPVADAPAPVDTAASAAAPYEALELVDGDEPTLPEAIDATLQTDAVIELAIVVMSDGAVGAVSVVTSSHPVIDEHAVAAVRAWRFKPVTQSQMRIVELVFHPRR